MNTRYNLKNEVITEIQERRSTEWLSKSYDEIIDYMHWVIESSIPVYTSDLLEIALSNLWMARSEPSNIPTDHVDPAKLISLNIYEYLCEEVQDWYDDKRGDQDDISKLFE